jgi:peptidoglycan hydrolase CwlO-like protein
VKKLILGLILAIFVSMFLVEGSGIRALDPVAELQKEIDELEKMKSQSENATKPLEKQLSSLETRISNARNGIANARKQVEELAQDIDGREEDLAVSYIILSKRIAASYKRTRLTSPLMTFLSTQNASKMTRDLMYRSSIEAQDNRLISDIGIEIELLELDSIKLEGDQVILAALEKQLNEQASFFKVEIASARDYQNVLGSKIATLSAEQQSIINARSGTYTTAVGDVPLADDFNASIGYKAQAPGNTFAVFSFGGYTHRNGMSQYGAKARADAGQNAEEILKAYYPEASLKKDYSVMGSISVNGVGTIPFEEQYLQGIYEVPASWPIETLKAQAIAARTYAVKYTGNGSRSICTTEACQVFKNSKKGGEWERAVNETRGWVLVDGGGNPVSTQYASTHGGYARTSGWDTTDKSNSGDWASRAWEAKANSPWFYKSWYRSGYSKSGANCGRNHPWLSQEEFSDIVNAWIVQKNPNGADSSRIQPVTINDCNIGGGGGNPYSISELRDHAGKSGGAVTNISSISVSHNGSGQTANVKLQTNRGEINIPGSEFKTSFNLRAPGYLRIPQSSFAFFNIEHKQ